MRRLANGTSLTRQTLRQLARQCGDGTPETVWDTIESIRYSMREVATFERVTVLSQNRASREGEARLQAASPYSSYAGLIATRHFPCE
jgi:hypothetical protein